MRAPKAEPSPSAPQIVEGQGARARPYQNEEPAGDGDVLHEVDHLAHVAGLIVEEPGSTFLCGLLRTRTYFFNMNTLSFLAFPHIYTFV